jgi:hypothetical protein
METTIPNSVGVESPGQIYSPGLAAMNSSGIMNDPNMNEVGEDVISSSLQPSNSTGPVHEMDGANNIPIVAAGAADEILKNNNNNITLKKDPATETLTDISADDESPENDDNVVAGSNSPTAIVSSSKKSRPPYKYDPTKITLRFLFANRDGLAVTVECKPSDTVGEVKGALLSVWPEGTYLSNFLPRNCPSIHFIFYSIW